jgi:hypothetical protein
MTQQTAPETTESWPSQAAFTINRLNYELNEARKQLAAMLEAIQEARKVLLANEFNSGINGTLCQVCFSHFSKGHKDDCAFAAAITKLQPFIK